MCVQYNVYSGEDGAGDVVSSGWALTNADVDFTVKVGHFSGNRAVDAYLSLPSSLLVPTLSRVQQ